ncbi:MAG: NAD(P)(+) transhydrogenase (Re/Si-specific) subunit beta [Bacillota bacterium]|nr:NAD(P)(+) transhydrogenase (Re/Si-specific) subunit beta [Bacillota bacterium]
MAITIIIASLVICGFLAGIRLMQSPRSALWGNRLGALSMLAAIVYTYIATGHGAPTSTLIYIAIGTLTGFVLGQSVKMIHMPQTVALLNGLGGAASALVAWVALSSSGNEVVFLFTAGLAVAIGALTFSGSVIAVLKLQGLAFRHPINLKGHGHILRLAILLSLLAVIINSFSPGYSSLTVIAAGMALLAGLLMALRIGGADMPIVISLLNSLSGIAAAVAGIAVENLILTGTGALVGVAGLILTRIMCRAMNRSLLSVLAGFVPTAKKDIDSGGRETLDKESGQPGVAETPEKPTLEFIINDAQKIIIVPGYGMAVAQAQMAVRELVDTLEAQGKEVKFAIHPVAGRMPGHMNVLLAEAGIDYDKLLDMDTINPQFEHADLVIAIGACDVINPAANSAENTPITGMPILEAEKARHIIICNLDEKPGYSGVDNLLYSKLNVTTIWGNASETVPELTARLKNHK